MSSEFEEKFNTYQESSNRIQNEKTWSFDGVKDLSELDIESELKATFELKSVKSEKGEELFDLPDIRNIYTDYEEFLKQPSYSFLILAAHPYFRGKIQEADLKKIHMYRKLRQRTEFGIVIAGAMAVGLMRFKIDRRRIFALTLNQRFFTEIFSFGVIPNVFSSVVDSYVLTPKLKEKTKEITKKYNFEQEAQTNPFFKQAFTQILNFSNKKYDKEPIAPKVDEQQLSKNESIPNLNASTKQ